MEARVVCAFEEVVWVLLRLNLKQRALCSSWDRFLMPVYPIVNKLVLRDVKSRCHVHHVIALLIRCQADDVGGIPFQALP